MAKKRLKKQPSTADRNASPSPLMDSLMRWGAICLVSAWMFLLGILVGRNTAPFHFKFNNGLQQELVTLREQNILEEEQRLRLDAESLNGYPDLDFHEALKTSEESEGIGKPPVPGPSVLASQGTAPGIAKPIRKIENKTPLVTKGTLSLKLEKKPGQEAAQQFQNRDKAASQPVVSAAPTRKPEPGTIVSRSEARFTVQVASFRKADDADRMVADLKQKNYPAYRIAGIIPDKGIWHRVRVGGFNTSAAARAMVQKLRSDRITAFVVSGK